MNGKLYKEYEYIIYISYTSVLHCNECMQSENPDSKNIKWRHQFEKLKYKFDVPVEQCHVEI